jgi:hypothetical protein
MREAVPCETDVIILPRESRTIFDQSESSDLITALLVAARAFALFRISQIQKRELASIHHATHHASRY